uniref:Uncharacterized protein n=1 Tax=Tanacetum cinerariifolium TaxID=118510 RepID=A0A6L2NH87_TANCI|nr:hypothetical protein [Tanacetum cinerariifolium]
MVKSVNWTVKEVDESKVYEIREQKKYMLFIWRKLAILCFLNKDIKGIYARKIYPLQDVSSWHTPHDFPLVLPPILGKNLPGRPKKKDRIPSQGEGRINNKCGRCGAQGHNRTRCNVPLPKKQTNGSKRIKSTHVPSVYKESQAHQEHQQPNEGFNVQMMHEPHHLTNNIDPIYQMQQEFSHPHSSDRYDSPQRMNSNDTWKPGKDVIKNTLKSVSVKGRKGLTSKKVSCSKSTQTKPFKDLKFFDDSSLDDEGNVFRGVVRGKPVESDVELKVVLVPDVVDAKGPPLVRNYILGLASLRTWQKIMQKDFGIKNANQHVAASQEAGEDTTSSKITSFENLSLILPGSEPSSQPTGRQLMVAVQELQANINTRQTLIDDAKANLKDNKILTVLFFLELQDKDIAFVRDLLVKIDDVLVIPHQGINTRRDEKGNHHNTLAFI